MPHLLVLAGPSAIGKSYTAQQLVSRFPASFDYAKVYTTRLKRRDENRSQERVFVSEAVFDEKLAQGAFFAYESFAGYRYGYIHESLQPTDKHLICDISPYLLPDVVEYANVIVLGLQAPDDFTALSEARMIERGDSPSIREARRPLIDRDMQHLRELEQLINQHGKLFHIRGNKTIPQEVIPWVAEMLGLPTA